ncbi:Fic family protein [Lysinibacillus sp. D4B1_S16]|uniref:Fic family protein n=1 Tax=Lysinibacillus sp. D4B1_S16 TaxID=2941231 RepID=UPI0020C09232|nr:Fic family protein [Lysinibacillus sp. D4B1_S16]
MSTDLLLQSFKQFIDMLKWMCTPFKIQEQMNALMNWNGREAQAEHRIVRGALLHAIFIGIHPFIDGMVVHQDCC